MKKNELKMFGTYLDAPSEAQLTETKAERKSEEKKTEPPLLKPATNVYTALLTDANVV